ncbi:MAG: outer membrane beta-barrel protein [Candidatus Krumholzibacteria bacterium]|jgi:hypothetical protein|nr:outer membrane beta-barrel protein [Candidatus Krumholzibacteria bacterium]
MRVHHLTGRVLLVGFVLLASAAVATAQTSELTGFVDAGWVYNTAFPNGEFNLNEVEVNFLNQASPRTLVRADVEWVAQGEQTDVQVEQAFMSYTAGRRWTLTLGKFNAPIGFEMVDAPDMHQGSHALVSDYGLPSNLIGLSVARPLGPYFDILAYGCNGWDRNTKTNGAMTWGGRFGYAREGFLWGVSVISGKEEAILEADPRPDLDLGPTFTRTVVDLDVNFSRNGWVLGGEYNRGKVIPAHGRERLWSGFLLMIRREFNTWMGLTARYDLFDDRDGYAFAPIGGRPQMRQAVTVAPTFILDEGFKAVAEFRLDLSNRDAFVDRDGRRTDRSTTVTCKLSYSF